MSISYSPKIVTDGLVHLLEVSKFNGSTSQSIPNVVYPDTNWIVNNFENGNSGSLTTLQSNAQSDGSGTSHILINRSPLLETGSITFQIWFNLKNIPINVGSNNNWREMLPSAANPLRCVVEQNLGLNWTTTHIDGVTRRNVGNSFTPVFVDSNGWNFITYTYNQETGISEVFKNNNLVTSNPMTTSGSNPTTPGLGLRYNNYSVNGFRIFGGTNGNSNPSGQGVVPGECGNIQIYNRALSFQEIQQNFNALRGRYGI